MAEKRTRRSFTREFKAQAVKRLLEGGRGLSEVATELGLSTGQLSTWRGEQLAAGSAEALAQRKGEEAETQRLRREVKRLEEENLILRKAAAVFAKGIAACKSRYSTCRTVSDDGAKTASFSVPQPGAPPSSPAPPAPRYAAAGLDRSARPRVRHRCR